MEAILITPTTARQVACLSIELGLSTSDVVERAVAMLAARTGEPDDDVMPAMGPPLPTRPAGRVGTDKMAGGPCNAIVHDMNVPKNW